MEVDYRNPRIGIELAVPEFYQDSIRDERASEREGRAVFVDVDRVRLRQPGNIKMVPDYIVTKARLGLLPKPIQDAYKQWKETKQNTVSGTPLKEWPRMTSSRVKELEMEGITTVEQVAGAAADAVERLKMQRDQQEAQRFLKPENEVVRELRKSEAQKDAQIAELEARLAQVEKSGKK